MTWCCFNFPNEKSPSFPLSRIFPQRESGVDRAGALWPGGERAERPWSPLPETTLHRFSLRPTGLGFCLVLVPLDRLKLSGNRRPLHWDWRASLIFLRGFFPYMCSWQSSDFRRFREWRENRAEMVVRPSHLLVYRLWRKDQGLPEMFLVSALTRMSL